MHLELIGEEKVRCGYRDNVKIIHFRECGHPQSEQ